jgi:hypothetical protein
MQALSTEKDHPLSSLPGELLGIKARTCPIFMNFLFSINYCDNLS